MRRTLVAVVLLGAILGAKEVPRNHRGVLLRMESVPCGTEESNAFSNAVFGTPTAGDTREERFCAEYILRSEGLFYRIRQKARRHPTLLPIGQAAQFRIEKDRVLLRVEDFDRKVHEFIVMAIVPEHAAGTSGGMLEVGKKPPQ